jgi:ribosomal protein S18 acetylase RimI-like enzyme
MARVRKYRSRDFVDYVATLEKTSGYGKESASELEAVLEKTEGKGEVWVAEVSGRAVGFMILTPNDDDSLEVDWLDVHPDFQRMGIGTQLICKAAKVAIARKRLALSVHTWETNQKMLGCAHKNGFEAYERRKDFYGKGKDAIRLKKRICS